MDAKIDDCMDAAESERASPYVLRDAVVAITAADVGGAVVVVAGIE